jgi:hypothetical protein
MRARHVDVVHDRHLDSDDDESEGEEREDGGHGGRIACYVVRLIVTTHHATRDTGDWFSTYSVGVAVG